MKNSNSNGRGVFFPPFDAFGAELDLLGFAFFGDSYHLKVGSKQTRNSRNAMHPAFSSHTSTVTLRVTH